MLNPLWRQKQLILHSHWKFSIYKKKPKLQMCTVPLVPAAESWQVTQEKKMEGTRFSDEHGWRVVIALLSFANSNFFEKLRFTRPMAGPFRATWQKRPFRKANTHTRVAPPHTRSAATPVCEMREETSLRIWAWLLRLCCFLFPCPSCLCPSSGIIQ